MKETVLNLMCAGGAFAPFRVANRRKPLIVTYHRFSRQAEDRATSARDFRAHLAYLTSRYRIVPLSWILEGLANRRALPAGSAAITIDDGYGDAYDVAFPLLREFRAPATLFVATDFVDRRLWLWTDKLRYLTGRTEVSELEFPLEDRVLRLVCRDPNSRRATAERVNAALKTLPDEVKEQTIDRIAERLGVELPALPPDDYGPITWQQAREMDAAGLSIESHSVTHPIMTNIGAARVEREVVASKARLESILGREMTLFCYPNGKYNRLVRDAVARAGYLGAVSTEPGLNDPRVDLFAMRRISAVSDLPHFVQSTCGFEALKLRVRNARTPRLAPQDRPTT